MQKITSKFCSLHLHLHLQVNICIFIDFAPSSWKTQQQHVLFSVYVLCSGRMLSWGRRDWFGYRFYKVEGFGVCVICSWLSGGEGVEWVVLLS